MAAAKETQGAENPVSTTVDGNARVWLSWSEMKPPWSKDRVKLPPRAGKSQGKPGVY